MSFVAKETYKELLQGVETFWHEYTPAKMGSVCLRLCGSFHGVPESGHNYQRHRGGHQAHSSSEELGDLHDQIVSWQLVNAAVQKLAALEVKVSEAPDSMSSVSVSRHRRVKLDGFETSCVSSVIIYLSYAAFFPLCKACS